ncbi:hypothetical protein B0H21DRAFT_757657, partial [Amylocystis lapponica]
ITYLLHQLFTGMLSSAVNARICMGPRESTCDSELGSCCAQALPPPRPRLPQSTPSTNAASPLFVDHPLCFSQKISSALSCNAMGKGVVNCHGLPVLTFKSPTPRFVQKN